MKKDILYISVGVATILLVFMLISYFFVSFTHIFNNETGIIRSDFTKINEPLSQSESDTLRAIVDNKIYFSDEPSCGFTEKLSFSFGGYIFEPACDGCPSICHNGKYINLTNEELRKVHAIFKAHKIKIEIY